MSNAMREALESMVYQFAYRGVYDGKPVLDTGGLSALEEAFHALGWDDPHYVPEAVSCDIEGCPEWYGPQVFWEGMYVCICSEHFARLRHGLPRPNMKERAIKREASRDEHGRLPAEAGE